MKFWRIKERGSWGLLLPFDIGIFGNRFSDARTIELRTRKWVREWTFRYLKMKAHNPHEEI